MSNMDDLMVRFSACLLVFMLTSCTSEPEPPLLRIGTNVWPGYEPLYLARELGYLDESKVKLVEYLSATHVSRNFDNGLLEGAALTLDEVFILQHVQAQLVLVMDYSNGGDAILGKPEIKNIRDIKGKRVAVEDTALGTYFLSLALEHAGLKPSDIIILPKNINEHENAYLNGEAEVIVTFDPVKTNLLQAGAMPLFDSRQTPEKIVDVLIISRKYMEQYSDVVKHVLDAWFKALDYIQQHPQEAAAIMDYRLKIGVDAVLQSYQDIIFPNRKENRHLLLADKGQAKLHGSAANMMAFMLEYNLLNKAVDIDSLFALNQRVYPLSDDK